MPFPSWASALETYFLTHTQGIEPSELRQARRYCRWRHRTINRNIETLERDRPLLVAAEHAERDRFCEWLAELNEQQVKAAARRPKQVFVPSPAPEPCDNEPEYDNISVEPLPGRPSIYRQLLRDPRWQRKRLEVFQRDEWMCQHCHATDRTLHVHHLRYRSGCLPWEYEMDELSTLCELCHAQQHPEASGC